MSREYGISKTGPYFSDPEESPLVPEIQSGCYILMNGQPERDKEKEEDILHNIRPGLFDADMDTLYFCELDT